MDAAAAGPSWPPQPISDAAADAEKGPLAAARYDSAPRLFGAPDPALQLPRGEIEGRRSRGAQKPRRVPPLSATEQRAQCGVPCSVT